MEDDLKELMKDHYLKYASYVILDRAIPDIADGLKPVQRRILHTLYTINDGKLHKVANVVGQTMAFHPHGDAAISDALTNLSNKGYLLDQQGNFGNLYTGDPAAAARYIETRLSSLALETMFNPNLTDTIPSYDGRNKEPIALPAKIPLLLMQGADGIAVGMSTRILPHNFVELLEAEIAVLENKPFDLYPDFLTGGIMDVSQYDDGRGKVKLRAKIEERDPKTLVITEICAGTTTESLIRSVDEAAKRGKIKIDSINDYTAEKVEIEIKLPRGHYAKDLVDQLYAFTDCEVSMNSQVVVIKDDLPLETDVKEVLRYNAEQLKEILRLELEIERDKILENIFQKTLEQIFIENRLYKKIENVATYEKIHETIEQSLKPFHKMLSRVPTYDDRERLLNIPIRRISRFDIEKNQGDIQAMEKRLGEVEKDLKQIKKVTIRYLKGVIKKYGKEHSRRTEVQEIEEIDRRAITKKDLKVGFNSETGFLGDKVSGDISLTCTNFDKLLLLFNDGTYKAINVPDKQYVQSGKAKVSHVGIADKSTTFHAIYRDPKTKVCFAKKFIVKQFILDKDYQFIEEGTELLYLSTKPVELRLDFVPKPKQKLAFIQFKFDAVRVKSVGAKGIRIATRPVKKVRWNKKDLEDPQFDLFAKTKK